MDALAAKAAEMSGKVPGVYITANPFKQSLLARACNRAIPYAEHTTSDGDIEHRVWFLLDFDPVRPSGISATDTEHEAAIEKARQVRRDLVAAGWSEPVAADSGNGAHLLFRVDLHNDPEAEKLLQQCIEAIAFRFSDDTVEIDRKVYNASRIWKLYGTMAGKGDSTPDRPHRMARLLHVPNEIRPVTREQLKALAAITPKTEPRQAPHQHNGERFDIDGFINRHSLDVTEGRPWNGGRKWIFRVCPWNSDHTDRSAYILEHASGAISAGCHHNGCTGNDWRSLREIFEPGCYDRQAQSPHTESVQTEAPAVETPRPPTPPGLLILPSDHYSYADAARRIFDELAPTHTLFTRGGNVVELTETDHGPELAILRPPALQSRLDRLGARVMIHGLMDGKLILKPKRCPRQTAEVLLESREAREILPQIVLLQTSTFLTEITHIFGHFDY